MSAHWRLEAHTTMDTTKTHLLELVLLMYFIRQLTAAACLTAQPVMLSSHSVPPLFSRSQRREDLRLTSTSSAVAHALSVICLEHWVNEHQNRTRPLLQYMTMQRYQTPKKNMDQTASNFIPADWIYFSHTIYIGLNDENH